MTNEQAKSELMQIYGMLSEEKKQALDVLMAQADGEYITQSTGDEIRQKNYDLISRRAVLDQTYLWSKDEFLRVTNPFDYLRKRINSLPPVTPQPKIVHCKDCKYFEYDSVAKVDGIPLIVAHEICNKWGDGCKTSEDGWCFLAEQKESENERMVES